MKHNGLNYIHPEAKLGENVQVGQFATIEGDVEIGDNTWIGPNAVIMNGARIGNNCRVFPGAIIGAIPQDLKFGGEYSTVHIGDNVTIREYCTINRGTKSSDVTIVGDNCLIMAYVHIAHDCRLGNNCILSNNTALAGHIEVGNWVVIGGKVAVHQFVKIGDHAFIGGGSLVRKDIPPFVKAAREPVSYAGVNTVGLRRRGFSTEQIHHIQDIYRVLYVRGYNTRQAVEIIEATINASDERDQILEFIGGADRGIMRGFRPINNKR